MLVNIRFKSNLAFGWILKFGFKTLFAYISNALQF